MKICPQCRQTYQDETLNFCLSDGTFLQSVAGNASGVGQSPIVRPLPQQPRKKSRAWLWVVGVVGGIVIALGAVFVGLVALGAWAIANNSNLNTSGNSNLGTKNSTKETKTEDFSSWAKTVNDFGSSELKDGEFVASTKKLNYYYVLLTGDRTFRTADAVTKVSVRNITGKGTDSGFGLVVRSNPEKALKRDYAFLIDSQTQSYRVVKHDESGETVVTQWTKFPIIRSGINTNELQVKDQNGKMSFYINNILATAVTDTESYPQGVVGIYVSDTVPIGFSNLQIIK